ncbi:MAG TPA: sigma-70 family RNA polymerase sigma factor [Actinomycetota bacterium]|nr:sigma-70 family RNA polymerase sigma factor [Actinomycetota bacterium]
MDTQIELKMDATAVAPDVNTVEFDEATLADESISGSSQAFEELYTHYFPKVRGFCIRKLGNPHLAEDIAQEAFARAFERISEFGGPRHFGGWVGTIAANLCTDHLRRKKPSVSIDQMEQGPAYEFDPIRNVQREDTGRLVRLALEKLDPRQREALVLHEVKGMSCSAVGEQLGISEVAAESLLARARRRLRKEITAKAIPADLFGLGGIGFLPALLRGFRRVRSGLSQRSMNLQTSVARGWDSIGGNLLPSVDAAKALVVVVGAALATQLATAATPARSSSSDAPAAVVSAAGTGHGGLLAVDGDGSGARPGNDDPSGGPVRVNVNPNERKATVSAEQRVNVPDPTGSDGETGLNVELDLEGGADKAAANTRVFVQDADGHVVADTGDIRHEAQGL